MSYSAENHAIPILILYCTIQYHTAQYHSIPFLLHCFLSYNTIPFHTIWYHWYHDIIDTTQEQHIGKSISTGQWVTALTASLGLCGLKPQHSLPAADNQKHNHTNIILSTCLPPHPHFIGSPERDTLFTISPLRLSPDCKKRATYDIWECAQGTITFSDTINLIRSDVTQTLASSDHMNRGQRYTFTQSVTHFKEYLEWSEYQCI